MAPEQLVYEVGNSIWKNKVLTVEDAARAVKDLVDMQVELIPMNPGLAASTMKAARESRIISFYDTCRLHNLGKLL